MTKLSILERFVGYALVAVLHADSLFDGYN